MIYSAFKDVALQFLGNLFEFFLVRKNEGKSGNDRSHLTVIGATSGDVDLTTSVGSKLADMLDRFCSDLRPEGQKRRVSFHHVPDRESQCHTRNTGEFIYGLSFGVFKLEPFPYFLV